MCGLRLRLSESCRSMTVVRLTRYFPPNWLRLASRVINAQKDKEVRAASGKVCLFSRIFKPITTARRRVTMKGIEYTTERPERRININIRHRVGVTLIKSIET